MIEKFAQKNKMFALLFLPIVNFLNAALVNSRLREGRATEI